MTAILYTTDVIRFDCAFTGKLLAMSCFQKLIHCTDLSTEAIKKLTHLMLQQRKLLFTLTDTMTIRAIFGQNGPQDHSLTIV